MDLEVTDYVFYVIFHSLKLQGVDVMLLYFASLHVISTGAIFLSHRRASAQEAPEGGTQQEKIAALEEMKVRQGEERVQLKILVQDLESSRKQLPQSFYYLYHRMEQMEK
ncbi:uncharacterized protein [Triticum aestivum]|uniref:uncharacterized protein n=1 Tax=Triticum aestivum TaxID=4565 RepID=UPI001D02A355|nr:uncharacterized protein LOC123173687 [Triticum aestivum]